MRMSAYRRPSYNKCDELTKMSVGLLLLRNMSCHTTADSNDKAPDSREQERCIVEPVIQKVVECGTCHITRQAVLLLYV